MWPLRFRLWAFSLVNFACLEAYSEAANLGLLADEHQEDAGPLRVGAPLAVPGVRAILRAINEHARGSARRARGGRETAATLL